MNPAVGGKYCGYGFKEVGKCGFDAAYTPRNGVEERYT